MRRFLLAGLLCCSPFAAAQQDSSSAGANASVEGGAALGATGVNSRPAARAEEAEKEKRRLDRAQRTEKKNEEK